MAHPDVLDVNDAMLHFQGFARVKLASLNFSYTLAAKHRWVSEQKVARLHQIFRKDHCDRYNEKHFVTAFVRHEQLEGIVPDRHGSLRTILPVNWEEVSFLDVESVECLNGVHRILAAKKHLVGNDRWWVVRICIKSETRSLLLPPIRAVNVIEEFENEQAYCDGDIFWRIRLSHKQDDTQEENKWWAWLSETKTKDLRQLLRDERYVKAFDDLLPWRGLWEVIRLGSLHRLLTMKCDEEILSYLDHIIRTWNGFFIGLEEYLNDHNIVDPQSVRLIETLAPSRSRADAELVEEYLHSRKIFSAITDSTKRRILLRNILVTTSLIPSLSTFFEDLKHLEPCAKILRGLLPPKQRRSICEALSACLEAPEHVYVEYARDDMRTQPSVPHDLHRSVGYQQLWLFAMRNFPSMTDVGPRKDPQKPKPETAVSSPLVWQEFGRLVLRLGFTTEAATKYAALDAEFELAKEILGRGGIYSAAKQDIDRVASVLRQAAKARPCKDIVQFHDDVRVAKERRCGRPFEADFEIDRDSLYLPSIRRAPAPQGHHLTTFLCKWDMFQAFFGPASLEVAFTALRSNQPSSPTARIEASCLNCEARGLECEQLRSSISSLSDRVRGLAEDNDKLRGESHAAELANAELRVAVRETSDAANQELQARDEIERLRTQLQTQATELATSTTRLCQLTKANQDLIAAAENERVKNASANESYERLLKEQNAATNTSATKESEHKSQVRNLETEIKRLKGVLSYENQNSATMTTTSQHTIQYLEQEKMKLQGEHADCAGDIQLLQQEVARLQQDNAQGTKRVQALQDEGMKLQEEHTNCTKNIQLLQLKKSNLVYESDKFAQGLHHEMSKLLSERDKCVHALQNEIDEKNYALVRRDQQIQVLQQQLSKQPLRLTKGTVQEQHRITEGPSSSLAHGDKFVLRILKAVDVGNVTEGNVEIDEIQVMQEVETKENGVMSKTTTSKRMKVTERYQFFNGKSREEFLDSVDLCGYQVCIGESMQLMTTSNRTRRMILESWRSEVVACIVDIAYFDDIRSRPSFLDFSHRHDWLETHNGRTLPRLADIDTEDEDDDESEEDIEIDDMIVAENTTSFGRQQPYESSTQMQLYAAQGSSMDTDDVHSDVLSLYSGEVPTVEMSDINSVNTTQSSYRPQKQRMGVKKKTAHKANPIAEKNQFTKKIIKQRRRKFIEQVNK